MDEYIVGQTYFFEGKPFTYKGGDPTVRESWMDGVATPAEAKPEKRDRIRVPLRSPVTDATIVLNMLQGGTANFADEILGSIIGALTPGKSMAEGRQEQKELVEFTKELHPNIAAAANIAGAAVPAGRVGSAIGRAGGSLATRMAAGSAAGAAGGLLFGAGAAEGGVGERLKAGTDEAALGALLGLVPAAPVATRLRGSTASRVAKTLEKTTGIARGFNRALSAIDQNIKRVRDQVYRPLQETFASINDAEVLSLLRSPEMRKHVNAIRPGLGRKVRPSFEDLQSLRSRLNKGIHSDRDLHRQVDELMRRKFPGLEEADAAYAGAQDAKRALVDGRKSLSMTAEDIERRLAGKSPEVRDAFNTGRLFRIVTKLEEMDKGTPKMLRDFLDMGPETRARMRSMFPSDKAFTAFERVLRNENSARAVRNAWRKYKGIAIAAGVGAGGYAAASRIGGGQ